MECFLWNGLYRDQPATLLIKKGLEIEKKNFPNKVFVEFDNFFSLLTFLYKNKYRVLFTPTPHPIPFLKKQFITLHDFYPFLGLVGFAKYLFFIFGRFTSKSKILVINKYVEKSVWLYLARNHIIFAPNLIDVSIKPTKLSCANYSIGLIGTDSKKKIINLFYRVYQKASIKHVALYGNNSLYAEQLVSCYGSLGLKYVDSKMYLLTRLLSSVTVWFLWQKVRALLGR